MNKLKKILAGWLLAAIVLMQLPVIALAADYNVTIPDKSDFEVDEVVTITGQNFEQIKNSGFICFNNLQTCFDSSDASVTQWTDNTISFAMPYASNVKQSGVLMLVGAGKIIAQFNYSFKPFIEGFLQNSKVVTSGVSGQPMEIRGLYFGSNTGKVKFGILSGTVISWKDNTIVVTVPTPINTDTKTLQVCTSSNLCASENFIVGRQLFDDPLSGQQTYLKSINYDESYSMLMPKGPITVAVIDDGIAATHTELKDHLWMNNGEIAGDGIDNDSNGYIDDYNGYNFLDDNSDLTPKNVHGTEVTGVIAASRDNEIGIAGIAPNARIMSLIICGKNDNCDENGIGKAIRYAVDNGARIINLSLAATAANAYSDKFNEVIKYAYDHNVLVVVAAGNGYEDSNVGRDLDATPESPICNDGGKNMVLGVGASDETNTKRTEWSNYGNCVDLYAPGENIATLSSASLGYATVNGTSFSTPIVSAVAAQILSTYPEMKNSTLISYMVKDGPYLDVAKLFSDIKSTYVKDAATPSESIDTNGNAVKQIAAISGFKDVSLSNQNFNAITYLRQNGVIEGFWDQTFRPEQAVTRAEMLKILITGGLGITPDAKYQQSCFTDLKASDWYARYVCYAKEKGWAQGYADGTFRPNQSINKVEAVKFLDVVNALSGDTVAFLPYSDVDEQAWYGVYLKEAFKLGLLEEQNNIYQPNALMTRGSIAESIFRLLLVKKFSAKFYTPVLVNKLMQ